jgi:hypothetical protein
VRRERELRSEAERTTGPFNATLVGLLTGLALGFAGAFGGFVAFLVVLVLAAAGTIVGLIIDGRIDVSGLVDRDRRHP